MDKLNKSFLYLFPIVYKGAVAELQCPYDYLKDFLFDIKNTYCFLNKYKRFVIELNFSEKTQKVLESFELLTNFEASYRTENEIVIVLKINATLQDALNKFILGKYSKFSSTDKVAIMKFLTEFFKGISAGEQLILHVNHVLIKSEVLRGLLETSLEVTLPIDSELSSIIDIKQETYEYRD